MKRPLELAHADLVGPIKKADLEGRRRMLASMDEAIDYFRVGNLHTKQPEEVWRLYHLLYPGSRRGDASAIPVHHERGQRR